MADRVLVVGGERAFERATDGAAPDAVLRREGFHTQSSVDDAVAGLRRLAPDLVLLDLPLPPPESDGVALCRRLRAADSSIPILVVSRLTGVADRVAGLEAGADDYVCRPFEPAELAARARALLRRSRTRRPRHELRLGDLVLPADGRASRGGRSLDLTPRERELLAAFLAQPEHVLPRTHLLDVVWGEPDVEPNVVDVYVGYLRRKLEGRGEPRLIWTVRGVGYVLREG